MHCLMTFPHIVLQSLIDTIPNPKIAEAVLPIVLCPTKSKDACVDSCVWNDVQSTCSVSDTWIKDQLLKKAQQSTDPLCKAVHSILRTGCVGSEKEACSVNPKCEWSDLQGNEHQSTGPALF